MKKRNRTKYSEQDFIDNFYETTKENGITLTNKGFNEKSKISYQGYRNRYKLSWIGILDKFEKRNEFINFIKEEYLRIYPDKDVAFSNFYANHPYFTYDTVNSIGISYLCEHIGINSRNYNLTEEDYKDNYFEVKRLFDRVPLYTEFDSTTKVSINSYATFYKLKTKVYDKIIKKYETSEEYDKYVILKAMHKTKVGLSNKSFQENKHSEEDLKENFKNIFEEYFSKHNDYPSKNVFCDLSKIDDKTYRSRLGLPWLSVCEYYGYKLDRQPKAEAQVVFAISNILNSKSTPRKTWKWLIGAGGKNMYCDGYFEEYNLVIEFDGEQHRRPISKYGGEVAFKRRVENDGLKDNLLAQHGINLIRIDSRDKWYTEEYLKERLKAFIIPNAQGYDDSTQAIS